MLKYLVCGAFAAALALPGTAQAWTFSASGSAACDRASGQYLVTWTIDNSSEPEVLTITDSNRSAVPSGATVGARASSTFTESVAGNTSGSVDLTVSGNWPSDSRGRNRGASVSLAGDCKAPPPPPPPPPPPAPPPPVTTMGDDCPNLEGVQGSVPEGWMLNDKGECVEKPKPPAPAPLVQAAPPAPTAAPPPAPAPPSTEPATEGVLGATVRPVFPRAKPKSPAKKAKAKVKRKAKVKAKGKKKVRVKVKAAKLKPCAPGTRRWKGRCAPIVKGNG